jgi:hypothetical protein
MTADRDKHQSTAEQRPGRTAITWCRAPSALWRRSSDRVVVLRPGNEEPLVLSGAGPAIWEHLDEPIDEHDLVAILVNATRADPDQVANDVGIFLGRLAEEGAVIRDGDEP